MERIHELEVENRQKDEAIVRLTATVNALQTVQPGTVEAPRDLGPLRELMPQNATPQSATRAPSGPGISYHNVDAIEEMEPTPTTLIKLRTLPPSMV